MSTVSREAAAVDDLKIFAHYPNMVLRKINRYHYDVFLWHFSDLARCLA